MIYKKVPKNFKPKFKVVGCFVEYNNKFLLLQRHGSKPEGNHWGLPGGKIDKRESKLQAIVREIKEELDVDFLPSEIMYEDDFQSGLEVWHVTIFGGIIKGVPRIVSEEISAALRWFDISELSSVDLASYTRQDFVKFGWIKE